MNPQRLITSRLATASLSGLLLAWIAPSAMGQIVAKEYFDSYAVGGVLIEQTGGGSGWSTDWYATDTNQWWTPAAVTKAAPAFANSQGDFITVGQGCASGTGRINRELTAPITTGSVWYSVVVAPIDPDVTKINEAQFWLTNGKSGDPYATDEGGNIVPDETQRIRKYNAVAGLRVNNGQVMYYDTSRGINNSADDSPDPAKPEEKGGMGEVYVQFLDAASAPVMAEQNMLFVINLELGAAADPATINYYVFLPGDDTSAAANASIQKTGLTLSAERTKGLDATAMFFVSAVVEMGNIRIGKSFGAVTPGFVKIADATMARQPPTLDGVIDPAWAKVPVNTITLAHGNKTITNTDLNGQWRAMWDANNLYVLMEVTDDEIIKFGDANHPEKSDGTGLQNDEFEFFTDGAFDRRAGTGWPPVYDLDDIQWVFRPGSDGFFSGFAHDWQYGNSNFVTKPVTKPEGWGTGHEVAGTVAADGKSFIAEIKFPWSALVVSNAAIGKVVGFEAQINDRDTPWQTDDLGNPVVTDGKYTWPSDGKKGWADGANNAWHQTSTHGTLMLAPSVDPIAQDDFADYTSGAVVDGQGAAGNGWAGGWYKAWQPGWTAGWADKGTIVNDTPISFAGDLLVTGKSMTGNNSFVRVARQLAAPRDAGETWVSFVMGNVGHLQVRLGWKGEEQQDEVKFNLDTGSTAGFTMDGGQLQYLDVAKKYTYKDPVTKLEVAEVYTPFTNNPYPNAPVLAVIHMDAANKKVNYYVFAAGDDISDPQNATWKKSLTSASDRAPAFDSFALFSVFSNNGISNLRIGDDYAQVIPPAALDPVKAAVANKAIVAPIIDGIMDDVWNSAGKANPIALVQGGKTIPDTDADGDWWALWDDTNLYLLFQVADDEVIKFGDNTHPEKSDGTGLQNDEFEVFTDAAYDRRAGSGWPPVYDLNDIQWVFRPGSDGNFSGFAHDWQYGNSNFVTKPVTKPEGWGTGHQVVGTMAADNKSYTAEVMIPWAALAFDGTPLAGGKIGIDIQLNDRDLPWQTDELGQPVITSGKYAWPSDGKRAWADGNNNAWHETESHGTLFLQVPATIAYTFSKKTETATAAGGNKTIDVTANLQFGTWQAKEKDNKAWVTVATMNGTGDDTISYSVAASTELYDRTAELQVVGTGDFAAATRAGVLPITQAGTLPAAAQTMLPGMTVDASHTGYLVHPWLGSVDVQDFPWAHALDHGWLYLNSTSTDAAMWLWDIKQGWLYTGHDLGDFFYVNTLGKWAWYHSTDASGRWFYIYNADGTGTWSALPESKM